MATEKRKQAGPQLSDSRSLNFFRAIRKEDDFTITYELACKSDPVAVESLSRTFGADLKYVSGILSRLERLGVVQKVGNRWATSPWARIFLEDLKERTKATQLNSPWAESALDGSIAYAFNGGAISNTGTYNGLLIAGNSVITHFDNRTLGSPTGSTEPRNTVQIAPDDLSRGRNEARNHDYK